MTYADEVFPRDAVAALANNDPDYPGSCGRCYEVRCHTGPVIANGTSIYRTDEGCASSTRICTCEHSVNHIISWLQGLTCGWLASLVLALYPSHCVDMQTPAGTTCSRVHLMQRTSLAGGAHLEALPVQSSHGPPATLGGQQLHKVSLCYCMHSAHIEQQNNNINKQFRGLKGPRAHPLMAECEACMH